MSGQNVFTPEQAREIHDIAHLAALGLLISMLDEPLQSVVAKLKELDGPWLDGMERHGLLDPAGAKAAD